MKLQSNMYVNIRFEISFCFLNLDSNQKRKVYKMFFKLVNLFILLALIVNIVNASEDLSDDDDSNEKDLKQAVEALASSASAFTSTNDEDGSDFINGDDDAKKRVKETDSNTNTNTNNKKCEEITVPMCRNMEYNLTSMPNQFNHETQQEAAMEAHQFWALVEINCAKELRFFLCSMYTPICLPNYAQPIKACKSVCVRARIGNWKNLSVYSYFIFSINNH